MPDTAFPARRRFRVGALPAALLAAALGLLLAWGVVSQSPYLTVVALLEMSLAVAIFARPKLGLFAFVAIANLLPFGVSPLKLFGFGPTFVDITLTAMLAGWLFWSFYQRRTVVGTRLAGPVLLYVGLAITSLILGLDYSLSPERLRLFFKAINSTLLFFSVANCLESKVDLRRLTIALMVCGVIASVIALLLLALPKSAAADLLRALGPIGYPTGPDVLRPIADTDILRAIGSSVDPNVLGGLLMMVSALLAGQLASTRPLLTRRWLCLMLAVAVAGLLLTYSRSALGGLLIGATVIGVYRDRRVLVALVIAALLLPLVPQSEVILGRLQSGLAFQDRGAAMRLDEYRNALAVISQYPWFGVGFGESPSIDLFLGVSSIYLLIGQEMGLVGLSSFLLILALLGWEVVKGLALTRDEEMRGVLQGLAAALIAATSAGLLDHYYVNVVFPHMIGLFWLYVGMAMVATNNAGAGRVAGP